MFQRKMGISFFFFSGHPVAYGAPVPEIRSKPLLGLTPQLWHCQMLNSLCWAGDPNLRLGAAETQPIPFHQAVFLLFSLSLFFFFWTIPTAYGGSKVKGQIRAVAASLHHSHSHTRILNPLSKARGRTYVLKDGSQIHFH